MILRGGYTNAGQVVRVGRHRAAAVAARPRRRRARCSSISSGSGSTARRASSAATRTGARRSASSTGEAAIEPHEAWALTDEALVGVAALLRRFHDAVASFDPSPHAWPQSVPGRVPRRHDQPQRPEPRQRHLRGRARRSR